MSRLVEELKVDHSHIKQVLRRAKDCTLTTSERFEAFITAKVALQNHLDRENRELYPVLRHAAQSDPESHSTLETFAKDMEQIASQVTWFFSKYQSLETVNPKIEADLNYAVELARDLETLTTLLGVRLGREEHSLYPVYDRVAEKGTRLAIELQVQDIGGRLIHIPIE
ncbi:MAG: hemerythrin domain-containing protein [Nitrospirota bacterium]|nr:hemerythrin domain-containing protein [Nitrospirota bacterium]